MNVTPQGLAVVAEACGMASARALSTFSPHEKLNRDQAATTALIRAVQASARGQQFDRGGIAAIERRLIRLHTRLADIRAALRATSDAYAG